MTCRIYQRPDGGVSVVHLVEKARRPGEADADFFARVVAKTPLAALPFVEIAPAALPARRFRDAWTLVTGAVVHDMPKARALRMAEIRAERDRRLAASDGPMLRAQEQGVAARVTALVAYRQALRNVPVPATLRLDTLTTPEALAAFEPTWPVLPA